MYKKAAGLVAKRGYTNVMVFKYGMPGWVQAGYTLNTINALPKSKIPTLTAAKLKEMLADVYIVDIRTKALYEMGWIRGSHKIPLGLLSKRYTELPKGKKVVVVDHAGKQVLMASRFLKSKGFDNVQRLQGGLMAWINQGYPLEKK